MAQGADVLPGSITTLLVEFTRGNREVEGQLMSQIYGELRRVAAAHMRRERGDHTLQPTALVNEVWMRLAADPDITWQSRAHFFAVASRLMRQILVDHARRRLAGKRGGGYRQITITDRLAGKNEELADVLALHQALQSLNNFDPRASRIVEMHFFGGLSMEEIAEVIGVSTRTVKRDWSMARAWLHKELAHSGDSD